MSGLPAAALYDGSVMHARMRPKPHRFAYRVVSLLIDLDRLGEAARLSPLFRVNRFALFSFHEKDHGPRDGASLTAHVRRLAAGAGVDLAGGRVLLLCYPRILGHVFNPLSVYYGYGRDGALAILVYEVRNTFGGMHTYVRPVAPGEAGPAGIRQEEAKRFYVSPFIAMDMRYLFRMTPPGDDVKIRILETDADGPLLAATFHGTRAPLSSAALMRTFSRLPFMTLKIVAAIHLEALRLWLKGMTYVPQPKPQSVLNASAPQTITPQTGLTRRLTVSDA